MHDKKTDTELLQN